MTIQPRRASNLLTGLGVIQCIPALIFGYLAISDFMAPPLSEARTWAYMSLIISAGCVLWAAVGLLSAYGLRKEKLYGWIIGLIYCVINAVFFLLFGWWQLGPIYIGVIWYLSRKQTRTHYMPIRSAPVEH